MTAGHLPSLQNFYVRSIKRLLWSPCAAMINGSGPKALSSFKAHFEVPNKSMQAVGLGTFAKTGIGESAMTMTCASSALRLFQVVRYPSVAMSWACKKLNPIKLEFYVADVKMMSLLFLVRNSWTYLFQTVHEFMLHWISANGQPYFWEVSGVVSSAN